MYVLDFLFDDRIQGNHPVETGLDDDDINYKDLNDQKTTASFNGVHEPIKSETNDVATCMNVQCNIITRMIITSSYCIIMWRIRTYYCREEDNACDKCNLD